MIYRLRIAKQVGLQLNWVINTSGGVTEYLTLESALSRKQELEEKFNNFEYEIVYQESGEWKAVEIVDAADKIPDSRELVNDHICPACGNNRCSRSEIKCWRCGNKL